jgi:hypothetical protein
MTSLEILAKNSLVNTSWRSKRGGQVIVITEDPDHKSESAFRHVVASSPRRRRFHLTTDGLRRNYTPYGGGDE